MILAPQELKPSCGEKTYPGLGYIQARGHVSAQISDKLYVQCVFGAICVWRTKEDFSGEMIIEQGLERTSRISI